MSLPLLRGSVLFSRGCCYLSLAVRGGGLFGASANSIDRSLAAASSLVWTRQHRLLSSSPPRDQGEEAKVQGAKKIESSPPHHNENSNTNNNKSGDFKSSLLLGAKIFLGLAVAHQLYLRFEAFQKSGEKIIAHQFDGKEGIASTNKKFSSFSDDNSPLFSAIVDEDLDVFGLVEARDPKNIESLMAQTLTRKVIVERIRNYYFMDLAANCMSVAFQETNDIVNDLLTNHLEEILHEFHVEKDTEQQQYSSSSSSSSSSALVAVVENLKQDDESNKASKRLAVGHVGDSKAILVYPDNGRTVVLIDNSSSSDTFIGRESGKVVPSVKVVDISQQDDGCFLVIGNRSFWNAFGSDNSEVSKILLESARQQHEASADNQRSNTQLAVALRDAAAEKKKNGEDIHVLVLNLPRHGETRKGYKAQPSSYSLKKKGTPKAASSSSTTTKTTTTTSSSSSIVNKESIPNSNTRFVDSVPHHPSLLLSTGDSADSTKKNSAAASIFTLSKRILNVFAIYSIYSILSLRISPQLLSIDTSNFDNSNTGRYSFIAAVAIGIVSYLSSS